MNRRDGVPEYELAVVVDDASMGVPVVVRGKNLFHSTAVSLFPVKHSLSNPRVFFTIRSRAMKKVAAFQSGTNPSQ